MLTLHQARSLLIGERTAVVSHTRRLLGEYGLVMAQGVAKVGSRLPEILEVADNGLPGVTIPRQSRGLSICEPLKAAGRGR